MLQFPQTKHIAPSDDCRRGEVVWGTGGCTVPGCAFDLLGEETAISLSAYGLVQSCYLLRVTRLSGTWLPRHQVSTVL